MPIAEYLFFPLVILFIFFAFRRGRGVPWAPTSRRLVHTMLRMAEVCSGDLVYDLGCGDGRLLIAAARRYGARAVGYEVNPVRYLWCQLLISILGLRDCVRVVCDDFFNQDLSDADVVTCYLLQRTNDKLESKLKKELRPGTRVVSNTFTFPGLNKIREDGDIRLYLSP